MSFRPNAFILRLVLASAFLTSCGSGALINIPKPSGTTSATSPLALVALAQSRDILVGLSGSPKLPRQLAGLTLSQPVALLPEKHVYQVQIPPGQSLLTTLDKLRQLPGVRYAEPNYSFKLPEHTVESTRDFQTLTYVPNDANYGLQWNMHSSKVDQAWDLGRQNRQITIGVIDSGVDPEHPDLKPHLLPLEDVWTEMEGADLFRLPSGGTPIDFSNRDGNGHGTHVAGIIGAVMDNQTGVAGVVGGGIRLLPIKATDYTGNTTAAVLAASFRRAIDKGVNVINISIGGPASKATQALVDSIRLAHDRNITIISATGNESSRNFRSVAAIAVPAAYPEVIAVGAHTEFDRVASYSNGGPEIDLVAPGGGGRSVRAEGRNIWSTWPTYPTYEFYQRRITSTSYAGTSGTSMACPLVTGVVALMLRQEPNLTTKQIRLRLISTTDDIDAPGFDSATGYGKLNALRALKWNTHDAHD